MQKLYIDFDGVILDTIDISWRMLRSKNIDPLSDEATKFYTQLDWEDVIKKSKPIQHSIECLKALIDSNLYDVAILTHVNSKREIHVKKKYLNQYFSDLEIISVDRPKQKCDVVDCRNAILVDDYMGNLILWEEKGGIPIKFSTSGKQYDCMSIHCLDELLDRYEEIRKLICN